MITPRRILISILLAGALVLGVWGLSQTKTTATLTYTDPAVRTLEPQPGALALRQERIGVTLAPNAALAQQNADGMSINGTGIPQDEIEVIPGLNQYFYTPGAGKEVSALPPGRNCVTLLIRPIADLKDPGHSFSWCFNSH